MRRLFFIGKKEKESFLHFSSRRQLSLSLSLSLRVFGFRFSERQREREREEKKNRTRGVAVAITAVTDCYNVIALERAFQNLIFSLTFREKKVK